MIGEQMVVLLLIACTVATTCIEASPFYRDPLFDGAHDPEIVSPALYLAASMVLYAGG